MGILKDIPVPTSYKRLMESKAIYNIHDRLITAWAIIASCCGFLLLYLEKMGITNILFYIIPVVFFIIVLLIFARNVKTLDKQILHVKLLYRIFRKENIVKKYVEPLDDLKKIVPVDTVEESGVIVYKDKKAGVLIVYKPPRTPINLRDHHSQMMDMVINSVFSGFTLQFISNSVLDTNNPLERSTSESLKNSDLPIQLVKTLNSLRELSKKKRDSVNWDFALVLIFPKKNSVKESEKAITAFMPGFMKALAAADIKARDVQDKTEVIRTLWRFMC